MSTVTALGDVPWTSAVAGPGWRTRRIGDVVDLVSGFPFDSASFTRTTGVRLVRIRDISSNTDITYYEGPNRHKSRINTGDLIVGMDGDYNSVIWKGGPAVLNQRMTCLRPHPAIDVRFLAYVLPEPLKVINDLTYFTTVKHLSTKEIKDIRFLDPGLSGQRKIADYLDRKTAAIDALIAKKERLIELLEEKRQALITQAVTKGLDPNVPMKDSGIEWLGEIPAHWEMKRLKHISPKQSVGVVVNPSTYVDDRGEVPFLFGANIREDRILADGARRISTESAHKLRKSRLRAGDLVTVRVGAPGVTAVVPDHLDGANCASVMFVRAHASFHSRWLCYSLNSRLGRYQVELVQYGAAQKQFNISHAVEWFFPTPPHSEQRAIARFLDARWEQGSAAQEKLTQHNALLREYRQALITAAVTGQLDVSEAG